MSSVLTRAVVVTPSCLDMSIEDDDQLYLTNETMRCGVSLKNFMKMSTKAWTILQQELKLGVEVKNPPELHLGVDVAQDFMKLISPCFVTGLITDLAYAGIKNDYISDLVLIADFFEIENLLDVAAEMIFEKAIHESGIENFTCNNVPVRVLDRVFPHNASDSARLHVLRQWAQSASYKPDDKAIELMRRIDPTEIEHGQLKLANDTMNKELFEYLRFKFYKYNHCGRKQTLLWA